MKKKVYRNPRNLLLDLKKIADNGNRVVLVCDQDGVLVEFIDDEKFIPNWRERMLKKGYFRGLPPIPNGIEFAKEAIQILGRENFWICTKGPTEHSYKEKAQWLRQHIPELDPENIVPIGPKDVKAEVMYEALSKKGIDPRCAILVDDYGHNLKEWYDYWVEAGGCTYLPYVTIKVKNGHNYNGKRNQLCPAIQIQTREESSKAWKAQKKIS